MTKVVNKVDFYSELQVGDVFSWHVMNGGPAKFAWVVLDVQQPFSDIQGYQIPNIFRGSRKNPVILSEIKTMKLFRTLRTPAPNEITMDSYKPEIHSEFKALKTLSEFLEDAYSQPEEILWLVKDPRIVSQNPRSSDTAERQLIGEVLEKQIWNALGYAGINYQAARTRYHIGDMNHVFHTTHPQHSSDSLTLWIRFCHHTPFGSHWSHRDAGVELPFWGAGIVMPSVADKTIMFQDFDLMTGTRDINKVWRWR